MPTSDLSTVHRPGLTAQRVKMPQYVHIIPVSGTSFDVRRSLKIPKADGDMSKTFEAALRTVPTLLTNMRYAVVIYGEEVVKYPGNVFTWLCGAGPDPSQQDPNWMGHAQEGVSGPNDVDIEHG